MSDSQETLAAAARRWWWSMNFEGHGAEVRRKGGAARAALAELRHAHRPVEVFLVPPALDLFLKLRGLNAGVSADRVAVLAVALANLKPDGALSREKPVPRAIGRDAFEKEETAAISEGRFRRLLQSDDGELLDAFRRLVRQMGGKLNPESLADSILNWGDAMRQRWIFEYYAVGYATPPRATADTSTQNEDNNG
jgi:CRISPR type I-E-associated protein CasB/Cse2